MNASVLLVGISTRAAAASAADAGYRVHAVDAFADLDQHPAVDARAVPRAFGPRAAVRAASKVPGQIVAYLAPFENHPEAIAALTDGRTLWGNGPQVVNAVRDPNAVVEAAQRHGLPAPRLGGSGPGAWLMKPRASGGGRGIRAWSPGMRLRRHHYIQEYLHGTLASVAFVANRRDAVLVGITRQLSGLDLFGARNYQYCGSIFDPRMLNPSLLTASRRLAGVMTAEFGLVGVNVLDVMIRDDEPYVLEVNPRWSASLELLESVSGMNLFAAHGNACASGALPSSEPWVRCQETSGKAIVYARFAAIARGAQRWLDDHIARDVPRPGTRLIAGDPICTVTAQGMDVAGCMQGLLSRAGVVYASVQPLEEPAA